MPRPDQDVCALSFNQNLSGPNVSNVNNMEEMLLNVTAFNKDIELWLLWDSSKSE
jgi:hypothetical protein